MVAINAVNSYTCREMRNRFCCKGGEPTTIIEVVVPLEAMLPPEEMRKEGQWVRDGENSEK